MGEERGGLVRSGDSFGSTGLGGADMGSAVRWILVWL
jgi:hypothetical protein